MSVLLIVLLAVCAVGLAFSFYIGARNTSVYAHRQVLLAAVHSAAQKDVERGTDWRWRYREFERVSYSRMMLVPRRLDTFHPNLDFIDPEVVRPWEAVYKSGNQSWGEHS